MKLGPYLLINLVLVGGGLFLYDSLKGDQAPRTIESSEYDSLQADDVGEAPFERQAPVMLSGGGNDVLARRVEQLEQTVADLRGLLASSQATSPSSATTGGPAPTELPALASRDLLDEERPSYDEATLSSLRSYMDEITRRKNEERQRNRVTAELERQGLNLSEEQTKAVVDQTLLHQTKARDLLRQGGWPRDEKGREDRREAFKDLQGQYSSAIRTLVPSADAEKILNSRVSRGMGFFSGSATSRRSPDRTGRRSGDNRNR